MAGPKCLILNRMQIPPFSDTDAVRVLALSQVDDRAQKDKRRRKKKDGDL